LRIGHLFPGDPMSEQRTFAGLAWSMKGKVTRRERFLAQMDAVIPWSRLVKIIKPHYPKQGESGGQPKGLERMLRIYFVQQWFDLSDPAAEDAIYDSESIRRFVGVELGDDDVPDESTILRFRHLLEKHELTKAIFNEVRDLLEEKKLLVRAGTIVDATIIAAPSSTKNREGKRDPAMRSTKKGNEWHFGMKVHVGTDLRGLVHTVVVTNAAEADVNQLPELMHGDERVLYGDKAYWCEPDRVAYEEAGVKYRVTRRGAKGKPLSKRWEQINHARSRMRALVEHPLLVMKRLWGFRKTRYRGLAKNRARAHTMLALANLYRVRDRLLPRGAKCAL
jgi:transposase, IS5 family